MTEYILYKSNKHIITIIKKILISFCIFGICGTITIYLLTQSIIISFLFCIIILGLIIGYYYFFWARSNFTITNEQILINVRNGFFSKYSMNTHFLQIKDFAYSKNHFFHYFFNYGTLFIRTSAAGDGSFIISDIPNVEEVFKMLNYIYSIDEKDRQKLQSINSYDKSPSGKLSKIELIEKVKNELLNIKGIKEVILLSDTDKQFIFKNEEDRNHGVYESIKRQISFAVTHDSNFRDPDDAIVLKLGKKVIFPPISFHEVKEKNTVSSSPGIDVHNYLIKKFKNVQEMDATLIIGFDY